MKTYRVMLSLRTPSGSAWQADTIFGHLCWLCYWRYGESKLNEWRTQFRSGEPPFILSDGFPALQEADGKPRYFFPRPVGLPEMKSPKEKLEGLEYAENQKAVKKIAWLTQEEFQRVRKGEIFQLSLTENRELPGERVTFKNQINRLTNTTGEEGQLYPFVEKVCWDTVTIYVRISGNEADTLKALFEDLRLVGYGKRKSIGYGDIMSCEWQSYEFDQIDGANGFVSLSHFVPAQHDPVKGLWDMHVKYGKLGGEWSTSANPFKYPLIMLTPGSWFRAEEPLKEWYGRVVDGVSPHNLQDVIQYGLAFAVPIRIESSTEQV